MNKLKKLLLVPPIAMLMLSAALECMAEPPTGDLWQVTEIGGDIRDHVQVDDVVRLTITPSERTAIFTPLGRMKDRLSMVDDAGKQLISATLKRDKDSSLPYYCGYARIKHSDGVKRHEIALSIVGLNWVLLNIDDDAHGGTNKCGQKVSHGGWAHIHR